MELYFEDYEGDYSDLNKCDIMKISRIDLCRHTMQVGYKNRSLFLNASLYKHLELFFMVMANVNCNAGNLMLKDEYHSLDQSEKVCISYQIGQGLTKAIAERYLKVPWVAHVKTMKNMRYQFEHGGVIKKIINENEQSGTEPDLIGFDIKCRAHLFESKGTFLESMSSKTIQKAINQVSNYKYFIDPYGNKQLFATRNACLFNFTPQFHGTIIDPPGDFEDEKNSTGLLHCLYNQYYLFLHSEMDQLKTLKLFDKNWSGYKFSFGDENYFWGINTMYKEFLQEQFANDNFNSLDYFFVQNEEENLVKVQKISNFFAEHDFCDMNNNDENVSIGEDGYILCNLNKI